MLLAEKYIGNLSRGFSERTAANRMIIFGLWRTNTLKATVHWAQEFQRIIRYPTVDGIEETSTFKESIDAEKAQSDIRNHNSDKSFSVIKATDPGKLNKKGIELHDC